MNILVIGGTGFMGSNTVRLLAEQGRGVVAYDVSCPFTFEGTVLTDVRGKFKVEHGSVTDLPRILEMIKKHNIEGIISLAALQVTEVRELPMEALQVVVIGAANILEAARIAGLRRVVITSSGIVRRSPDDLITPTREEVIQLPPSSIHGLSKLALEHLAYVYRLNYGVDAIAIRPEHVYGPSPEWSFRTHTAPIWEMVADAVGGKPIIRETGGDSEYDFTYVKDFAKGIIQAYDCESPTYYVYNMTYGKNRKVSEVCDILRGLFPNLTIEVGPGLWKSSFVRGDQQENLPRVSRQKPPLNITRAREDFGFEPEWDIDRAIPDWVRWLKGKKYCP